MPKQLTGPLRNIIDAHLAAEPANAPVQHFLTFEYEDWVLATFESSTPFPAPAEGETFSLYGTDLVATKVTKSYETEANEPGSPCFVITVYVDPAGDGEV